MGPPAPGAPTALPMTAPAGPGAAPSAPGSWPPPIQPMGLTAAPPPAPGSYPVPGTPEWHEEQALLTASLHEGHAHAGHDHPTTDRFLQRVT